MQSFVLAFLGGLLCSPARATPVRIAQNHFSTDEQRTMQLILDECLTPAMRRAVEASGLTVQKGIDGTGAFEFRSGGYHPETRTIDIAADSKDVPNSTWKGSAFAALFAHELGHALIFSGVQAADLRSLAESAGPWSGLLEQTSPDDSLMQPLFFHPHPRLNIDAALLESRLGVPSRYALRSVHEWFAEMFSIWIQERLIELNPAELKPPGRTPRFRLNGSFEKKLDRLFTRFDTQ
jgi:hypothetical protein